MTPSDPFVILLFSVAVNIPLLAEWVPQAIASAPYAPPTLYFKEWD